MVPDESREPQDPADEGALAAPMDPSSSNEVPPEIMTIDQAARYLQLHPQVVYRHIRAGTLPASRIGRTIRFKRSVLDAFLEKTGWESVRAFMAFTKKQAEPQVGSDSHAPLRRKRKGFSLDFD